MSYIGGLDPERGCKAEVNLLHHDGLTLCTANAFKFKDCSACKIFSEGLMKFTRASVP